MNLSSGPLRLAAAGLLMLATLVHAQPPRQPPTPILLKRLAEAMDGNRTGVPLFLVASYDSLNPVRGAFPTRPEAERLARRLGPSYDVFGPFVAALDPQSRYMLQKCTHDGTYSNYDKIFCPSETSRIADVVSMTLVTRMRDGTIHEMGMGANVDAIFLTLPAIDKFMIPYYARTVGVDSAAAMRSQIVRRIPVR